MGWSFGAAVLTRFLVSLSYSEGTVSLKRKTEERKRRRFEGAKLMFARSLGDWR
jgi:hypothetical protein